MFVSLCVITLCILVLSFEFDFVWSTRYFPRCILSMSVMPCPALSCLDVSIKYYYLSLRPRLRVPVPPSCVHRDSRKANTYLKIKRTLNYHYMAAESRLISHFHSLYIYIFLFFFFVLLLFFYYYQIIFRHYE